MLTLYYSPGACSLAPHIALLENGLSFNLKKVDLATHTTEDKVDLAGINAKNSVPVIQLDNNEILTEAAAILFYIAETGSNSKDVDPADAFARYRLQEALTFVSSELHKGFGPFFNKNIGEDYKSIARDRLRSRLDHLEKLLTKQEYIAGNKFTTADAYCFTVLRWVKVVDCGLKLNDWPKVNAYYDKILTRPKVKQALDEEKLTKY